MKKRKKTSDDASLKDTIVFYAMPFVAWGMLVGLVVGMVRFLGAAP